MRHTGGQPIFHPRWFLVAIAVAAVLVVAGLLVRRHADMGDPTAGAVRDAVARVVGAQCSSGIVVRNVKNDGGGPGLADSVRREREIVCRADVRHPDEDGEYPQLAVQDVYASTRAARNSPANGAPGVFRHGRTIVGSDRLSPAQFARVRAILATDGG